jgi:hypothetical protein
MVYRSIPKMLVMEKVTSKIVDTNTALKNDHLISTVSTQDELEGSESDRNQQIASQFIVMTIRKPV